MAYDLATVTNSGNQLLASVVPDKSSLVIDKIEVSGTQLASSTDLKTMTSISNVVQTLSANGYQKKDNSFIISTVLDNSSVKVDYKAWVFGIWAHKADGGSSILMSVITSTNSPDTISKGSGTPIDYNYKFITTFSNTKSLKIQMSSDTYATNDTVLHNSGDETSTGTKTFQEIKISNKKFPSLVQTDGQYVTLDGGNTEIVPADNSKVVHTTGDETIDGKKKFDTDPTDGAGNAYAKTVDVNQQLDKKVNVADMRKPANDVAGIEEVNAKQDKIGYTPADDNKVVHKTGTEEIGGQKTFDVAPIDKTTGNPYITKDGVPSLPPDLARTGQAQTFTAAQTFSIAPTIKDASKDKGDNQAATMADLKSVENSAWRVLKEDKVVASGTCPPIEAQKVLYQVDSNSNRLYLSVSFQLSEEGVDDNSLVTLDFSGVIKNITGFKDGMSNGMGIGLNGMDAKYSGPKVIMNMKQQTGCWPDNNFWISYD